MGPAQAIRTGFAKSLKFSGRSNRSEFWWFVPAGLALPIAVFLLLRASWPEVAVTVHMLLASIFLIPQIAVTARRLEDTGQPQSDLHAPLGAYVYLLMSLWLTQSTFEGFDRLIEQADSPGGFGLAFIPIAMVLLTLDAGIFLFGICSGASLLGQMLIATHFNSSNSRPNPSEALK